MATEKLYGRSMMMADGETRVILHGEIALMTDGAGRSEIQVRNDDTGQVERLVFTSGALWIPVMQMMQAIRDTHDTTAPLEAPGGPCSDCSGDCEYEDADGNWRRCGG